MTDNKLFILNAFLIAGLVGAGFLLQQSGSNVMPIVPGSPNTQMVSAASSATTKTPLKVVPDSAIRQNSSTTSSSTPAIPAKKKTTTTPSIQRRSRNHEYNENE